MADGASRHRSEPLGVPSRTSVRCWKCTWAGLPRAWATIADLLRDERTQVRTSVLTWTKVYNTTGSGARIDRLTGEEVMEMAQGLKNGVPFATPVFDGATEEKSPRCWSWPIGRRRRAHGTDAFAYAGMAV